MNKEQIEAMNRASCAICLIESKENCKACPWQKYHEERIQKQTEHNNTVSTFAMFATGYLKNTPNGAK